MLRDRTRRIAPVFRRVTLLGLVLLLLVPAMPGSSSASVPLQSAPQLVRTSPLPLGTSSVVANLPGSNPWGEPTVDAPALALAQWTSHRLAEPPGASPLGPSRTQSSPASARPAPWRTMASHPSASNGSVRGVVEDGSTGRPVGGADVILRSLAGTCPTGFCPSTISNGSGGFVIFSPAGSYDLGVTASNYSENDTVVPIVAGRVTNLGAVLLLPYGFVTGRVISSDSTHSPLANVSVTVLSRNLLVVGGSGTTVADGSFRFQTPPIASRIDFVPPGPLQGSVESNQTFADPPSARTTDLGTIELVDGTWLNVTIRDRVTGVPIGPKFPTRVIACSAQTTACAFPDADGLGAYLRVAALPGPTILHVVVLGYVVNVTPIPSVPVEPSGVSVAVVVNVTPLGVVRIVPAVNGGDPTVGGNVSRSWWTEYNPSVTNVSGAAVCSLEGIRVGVMTVTGLMPGVCAPAVLDRFGGPVLLLGPPLRDYVALGDFTGVAPMFGNSTWVNLTADRVTDAGYLNFTPGAYVTGFVYSGNGFSPPGQYSVTACSTDADQICGPPFPALVGGGLTQANSTLLGCDTSPGAFCVAAPPGPVKIVANGPGGATNWTWAEIPEAGRATAPAALPLRNVTDRHTNAIRLPNGTGTLSGSVESGGGPAAPPIVQSHIEACPVDSTSSAPCAEGLSIGSTFNLSVPLGWDRIEVTAAGYQANRTWIDVTGSNRTGPIVLASQAIVHGLVLDRNGSGILGAAISYCPVATAVAPNPSCAPLDLPSGTDASGFFSGHLPGAAFPAGSFEIVATASGYFGNWSWVNATPGAIVFAPPIHLTLVGSGAPRAPFGALARPRPSIQGPWVDGRVLDAVTGAGIHGVNLIACPVSSTSSCVSFTDSTSTGGEFNASLTTGAYWLNASETGYADAQIYVNATGTRPVHLGTFLMKPNPLVTGRAVLDPWENESLSSGLGPSGASVSVCNRVGTVCGAGAVLSTAGFFEATGPAGTYDTVAIVGTGGSNFDSLTNTPLEGGAPQGYDPFETSLNVSAPSVSLGLTFSSLPRLAMFSGLSGGALDGSSRTVPGGVPTLPARWASVQVNGTRPNSNFAAVLSGGGRFTLFLPGGEKVRLEAVGSAFRGANATGVAVPTGARTSAVPSFDLPHYGWVESTIHASNGAPIPYAPVSATLADPANGTSLSNSDIADGTGFVNVSAPTQGSDVVRTTPVGYGNSSVRVEVLPSETSPALLPNVAPVSSLTHVESWEVNDVGVPLVTTVVDPTTGAPVPEALIGLSAGGPTSGIEAQVPSNGLGQFLLSAPLSSAPSLVVHATGYSVPRLPVISAPLARIRTLNLTADGILALRVVGLPGPTPLPGANVTACSASYTGPCSTVEANGEGIAWIATPPGLYSITIQAVGYLGNVSYPASTCSDCFDWLGNLTVYADSVVLGRVVDGLFGTPIVGANVTLCPVGGGYAIYCLFPTPTDGLGGFAFPAPAGIYWLNATAADHGLFSLELEVRFGQTIAVGDLALAPDGALSGSVVDGSRSLPIAGAQVFACPIDGSACAGPAVTDPSGRYTIPSVSPGAERLLATALGYASGFGRVLVPPGAATLAPPILLYPLGVLPTFVVSGTVVWNSTGRGIGGASIVAVPNGAGLGAQTLSAPNGSFAMALSDGSYALVAGAPGAATGTVAIRVNGSAVLGIRIALLPRTYPVGGTVTAFGSTLPVPGVEVDFAAGGRVATTSNGSFRMSLSNGSYQVTVTPGSPALASAFRPISEGIEVNGAGLRLDLVLPERVVPLHLLILDRTDGQGLEDAVGRLAGTTGFGVAWSVAVRSDGSGRANLSLPPGAYGLHLNASGFEPVDLPLTLPGSGANLTVALPPRPSTPPAGLSGDTVAIGLGGAILTASAVVVFWRLFRKRPKVFEVEPIERTRPPEVEF